MNVENPEYPHRQAREIYLKEEFIESVLSGSKTIELRVAFPSFSNINMGDVVIFKSGSGKSAKVEITIVRRYHNLSEVLQSEDISKIAPNMTRDQIQRLAPTIFSKADIEAHGLMAIEFKLIE
jgi:ASC-1-like (ASCH) protein